MLLGAAECIDAHPALQFCIRTLSSSFCQSMSILKVPHESLCYRSSLCYLLRAILSDTAEGASRTQVDMRGEFLLWLLMPC